VKTPMRDSSYNFHTQTQQIFSRGGEKKVMKKSLSILLSFALVFGLFASMASAADTELTVAQKYQVLVDKGVLKGNPDGDARLDANLNRAEFATIAIAISGLAQEKPATATFSDVNSKQWWYGAIEAAAKAGLVEGYNGKFDPKANVTVEQVIKVAVQAAGLEIDEKAEAVEGASTWAAPYIKAALDAGLIATGLDYKADATRGQTILVGYSVYEKLNPTVPAKASIASAKATGVKKVTVELNKAVDDTKATLSLKKGTLAVATKTVWAEDKKSATLELTDVVIGDGEYTVTLAGLEADEIDVATAKFTGEKEVVKSIEFVNTSEYVAYSPNNIIKLKALNQYGEAAAANPGSYTVYAGRDNDVFVKLAKDAVTGDLLMTLKTDIQDSGVDRYPQGTGIIAVNVINNDSHVHATKTFKMGTVPFISKMDISAPKYSNGKDFIGGKGENAIINVNQFDQYGNIVAYDAAKDPTNIRFILNGYEPQLDWVIGDSNNDDVADIKLFLKDNVDKSSKFAFTVNNQAGNASGEISIQSAKTANKIEFGEAPVVAAGDGSILIPVVAYDANGAELSVDDLVNEQNAKRLSFSSSTANGTDVGYEFITSGANKGKLEVKNIPTSPRSVISLTAIIATANASSVASKQISVADARIPTQFKVVDEAKQKIVNGGKSGFKLIVIDQYGAQLNTIHNLNAQGTTGVAAPDTTNSNVSYKVVVTTTQAGGIVATGTGTYANSAQLETYNGGFAFDATAGGLTAAANATFEAKIVKVKGAATLVETEVAKISRKIEATDDTLTYSVSAVSDLFNAIDSRTVVNAVYGTGTLTADAQKDPLTSKFAKTVELSAVDAAGNTVAIPQTIKQLTSSNSLVAVANATGGVGKVIGNGKGTATLNVTFETSKGLQQLKTITVNTKDDVLTSTKVDRGNGTRTLAEFNADHNAFTLMNVKVTDNYGITYEGADAQKYNRYFGVTFTATNIKKTGNVSGGSVTIDQYGNITASPDVVSFELTATTATGFSATTYVK